MEKEVDGVNFDKIIKEDREARIAEESKKTSPEQFNEDAEFEF